ncbi:MAG: glycosyltransferase [Synergistetes bacterium]|nr:glycosyltransferase [Synergistota bacterium]
MSLDEDIKIKLKKLGKLEVIIGIPSYNNCSTIGNVIKQAAKGIKGKKGAILNSDGSSSDGTPQEVNRIAKECEMPVMSFQYRGISGKGSSIKAILEAASTTGADAIILLDSDLRNIKPSWSNGFYKAIESGYDLITPYYIRHKYDGTITNHLVYPLVKGIYGIDIRQPIGGDFGISGRLAEKLLEVLNSSSNESILRFGIDIFITLSAVANRFKVAQLSLGAKIHDPKDPAHSLKPMFIQVVHTLFSLIEKDTHYWKSVKELTTPPILGNSKYEEPPEVKIDRDALFNGFYEGLNKFKGFYNTILAKESSAGLFSPEITSEAWANVLYDFLLYFKRTKDKQKVVERLLPLYLGRTLAFVTNTEKLSNLEAENIIQRQAEIFWERRQRFIEKT